ncbi:MAG: YggS family pyridoxal phosphate-dependent enzyme [Lachnospiraceae bacterium]|nr:YggS family pyridoxal phosphate-dependent enzyme [Lachnospiraceae bacterium]
MVQENLTYVEKKIAESCEKAKRSENEVTLIAVSKTKPIELIMEAYDAGIREFGENKVQELVDKFEKMPKDIHWHLIGHLQTNKVKYIIDKAFLIHGVDSMKLAQEISKEAKKHNLTANILVQINIGHEESKSGIDPSDTVSFVKEIAALPNLTIKGLMAIAPYVENPEDNRQYFEQMKKLSVDITQESVNNVSMDVLSMGMTGDYQVAIEEGATYVRVGTGIFGDRIYR